MCMWYEVVFHSIAGCDNLWFDDLCAELIEDRLNIVFSRDVILCG